jgi:hypothetical protein
MHRESYFGIPVAFLIFALFAAPLPLSAGAKDLCGQAGIIVKNMTMIDLWYKKNGGNCTILIHEHIFRIKPKDDIEIFSDLACKKNYCNNTPTYRDYKSLDANGDCSVRILPSCNLSDM